MNENTANAHNQTCRSAIMVRTAGQPRQLTKYALQNCSLKQKFPNKRFKIPADGLAITI